MNILFVLYGPLASNSGVPLALHARGLAAAGHHCAVAVPRTAEALHGGDDFPGRVVDFDEGLRDPCALFPDGRPADVVHAWTPRENVRGFVTAWLARHPAPLVMYLEDNERVIALEALGADGAETLLRAGDDDLAALLPQWLPHPFRFEAFIGLADAAVVIQDKLGAEVPPWVPCETVLPGVDLALFAPQPASSELRSRYGVAHKRVIVYPGAMNAHTRAPLRSLCEAVGLLQAAGTPCRLLRTGPIALDFLADMPWAVRDAVVDLGVLPRSELPQLLALADVLVQPGRRDAFDDLRLPGKVPEFLAMGKPVVLPDANVAHLLTEGENVLFTRTGSAEEIATRCAQVFADPVLAKRLGEGARRLAEATFDAGGQAARLLAVYERALRRFDAAAARRVWAAATDDTPPAVLLARRLRELPAAAVDMRQVLPIHRDLLRRAQRALADGSADLLALHGVLRERAREVASLQPLAGAYAQALLEVEQRLAVGGGRPGAIQRARRVLRQATGLVERVRLLVRQKGGIGGMAAVAWRISTTEGWPGVRRRVLALLAAARLAAGSRRSAARSAAHGKEPATASLPSPLAAPIVAPAIAVRLPVDDAAPDPLRAAGEARDAVAPALGKASIH